MRIDRKKYFLSAAAVLLAGAVSLHGQSTLFRPGESIKAARAAIAAGDYARALEHADSVSGMSRSTVTKVEGQVLKTEIFRNVGNFYEAEKAFDEAERLFEESEVLKQHYSPSSPEGLAYSSLLLNRAQFELSLGRYEECEKSLAKVRFVKGSEGYLRQLGTTASLAFRKDEPERALVLLDAAIDSAGDSPTLNTLIGNRAFILGDTGRWKEAIEEYYKALENTTGKQRGTVLAGLAYALAKDGQADEAMRRIDESLRTLSEECPDDEDEMLTAIRKKGEIEYILGKNKESAATMRRYFEGEKKHLARILPAMPPQMRLDFWVKERPLLSRAFMVGETDPELMMDLAVMRRETSLPHTTGPERLHSADSDVVRSLLRPGEAAVAFVLHPLLDSRSECYSAVIMPYKGAIKTLHLFDADFLSSYQVEGEQTALDAILTEDPYLKNKLYTDSLLAEMVWRPVIESLNGDIRTIHFAPEGVFHLWGIENMPYAGAGDYRLLRHFSLLDIAPSSTVSLEDRLIVGGIDYDFAPETASVNEESSVPDHTAYSELKRILRFKDGEPVFSYLPGTLREAESIAALPPGTEAVRTLSEETFKEQSSGKKILHLATHGYSLESGVGNAMYLPTDSLAVDVSLLRTGVALSGANVLGSRLGGDDGLLSAREICNLDLRGVDLVILSACQTARGFITDESASGLIRALKIAGAGTIVASLWEVDDNATSIFMETFHKALSQGKTKEEAFNEARSTVAEYKIQKPVRHFRPASMAGEITGYKDVLPYSDPWYWAPFIIIDP